VTIAACLVTPGGVVLGADSTTTIAVTGHDGSASPHYFDHVQKLFEIGEGSTLGAVTWGLGAFADVSYRVLFAELGDQVAASSCSTVRDVAVAFAHRYWATYSAVFHVQSERARGLGKLSSRTTTETVELKALIETLSVGFCIAGYLLPDRRVRAFELVFSPILEEVPAPRELQSGQPRFWGVPMVMNRLTFGIDSNLLAAIVGSPHWTGSSRELLDLIEPFVLRPAANLPIREAIDYIHSVIVTTSKGLKFSQLPPVCGGQPEVAAITADRRFRWVKHKTLDQALS
jgi:hypothetical protein